MAELGGDGAGKNWYEVMMGLEYSPISAAIRAEFSQVKPGEEQLKFCIKILRMFGASSLAVSSNRVKNNDRAKEYRKIGNDLFSSNEDAIKVAEMYTKSIAYALPGSRELALAYANRSAVSFKAGDYEECLIDIERSLENGYPEEMKAKLHARRVRCLLALKKPQTDFEKALEDTREALLKMDVKGSGRNLVEQTLTDKNHMAPTPPSKKEEYPVKPPAIQDDSCEIRGATGIAIEYSETYGRHVVATKDIQPGEIIAVIDSYAHFRTPKNCYRDCNYCTMPSIYGIPCDHCVNVTYCSTTCRDEAWKDWHENECPILGLLLDMRVPDIIALGIRIALKAVREAGSVIELKKLMKRIDSVSDRRVKGFTGNVFDTMNYSAFTTLANHAGKHPDESYLLTVTATFTISFLASQTNIFGQKYNGDLSAFKKNPLLLFLGALIIKNCEILEITASRGGEDLRISAPLTALCNHSCDSNVMCLSTDKSVDNISHQRIMYALQPIKAGEQLFDCYANYHHSNFPKEKRQEMLKKKFFFTCNCVPCTENWPMYGQLPSIPTMPGLSPTVRTQLTKLAENFMTKYCPTPENKNMLVAKDDLVQLIELLHEHAYPSQQLIICKQKLTEMYRLSYMPSRCTEFNSQCTPFNSQYQQKVCK